MTHKNFHFYTLGDKESHHADHMHLHGPHAPIPPTPPTPPTPPMDHAMRHFVFNTGRDNVASTVYQEVDDDILEILIALPGITKDSLKVRSKTDRISISALRKSEYVGKLGEKQVNMVIDLVEDVHPDQSTARYSDGILHLRIPVAFPGKQVEIETEDK